jgi:hypothetical protein
MVGLVVGAPPLFGVDDPALGVDVPGVDAAGVVVGVPDVIVEGVVVGAAAVGPAAGAAPPAVPCDVGRLLRSSLQPTSS